MLARKPLTQAGFPVLDMNKSLPMLISDLLDDMSYKADLHEDLTPYDTQSLGAFNGILAFLNDKLRYVFQEAFWSHGYSNCKIEGDVWPNKDIDLYLEVQFHSMYQQPPLVDLVRKNVPEFRIRLGTIWPQGGAKIQVYRRISPDIKPEAAIPCNKLYTVMDGALLQRYQPTLTRLEQLLLYTARLADADKQRLFSAVPALFSPYTVTEAAEYDGIKAERLADPAWREAVQTMPVEMAKTAYFVEDDPLNAPPAPF